ncbi:MAG: ECF transporter S component [Blautia sp.]|nr:ECF transporter S component [Blautia sp.]
MQDVKIRKLVFSALMAALCCAATMSIRIPTFATNGYVNAGDTIVLLSAWLIGGGYGALAAGTGSALSDLLSGYMHYVPGTFAIKLLMALAAWFVMKSLTSRKVPKAVSYIASAVTAEAMMIVLYFLYQCIILGYGLAASASVPGNIAQGITCSVIAIAIAGALASAKIPARLMAGQH